MRHIAVLLLSAAFLLPAACCQTKGTTVPDDAAPPDRESAFAGWESTANPDTGSAPKAPKTATLTTAGAASVDEADSLRRANRKLADTVAKLMREVERMKTERAERSVPLAAEAPTPAPKPAPPSLDANRLRRLLLVAGVSDLKVGTDRAGRVVVTLPASASFASGKATLTRGARARLGILGSILVREAPDIRVRAEGHTDTDPIRKSSWKSNQELSEARARAVADFLVAKGGLGRDRVGSVGYGDKRPIASNRTRTGKARNRRVEIVLVP